MLRNAVCVAGMLCLIGADWAPAEPATAVLPVTADVGITSVRGKMRYSNALGPSTAIRQNQNWSGFEAKTLLMAFDASAIKGWTVREAHLNLYVAKNDLYGLGLCTVLSPWEQGQTLNWTEAAGSSCWDFVRCPEPGAEPGEDNWWAWPGSAIYSVSWAHPSARYSHAGPKDLVRGKSDDGRFVHLQVPVDPALVESLAIGACYGLILTDDKGQVAESYSLMGPAYPYRYNEAEDPWVFTNDIQEKTLRPTLEVVGEAIDQTPPAAPSDVKVAERNAGDGSIVVTFVAPGDDGTTGTALAYEAVYSQQELTDDNFDQAEPLPRWSLPLPVEGGKLQPMPVFTLSPGQHQLAVRAVDEAGHRGPCATVAINVPVVTRRPLTKAAAPKPVAGAQASVADAAGKLTVFACPDMVKVDPVSGAALADGDEYRGDAELAISNTVWGAGDRRVSLRAAANEVAAFKLLLGKGQVALTNVQVAVDDLVGSGGNKIAAKPNAQLFRLWYVWAGDRPPEAVGPGELDDATIRPSAWHGDACLPLAEPFDTSFNLPAADNNVPGQRYQAVWVDLYVPGGTAAGDYEGTIRISADELAEPVELRLAVEVLPFSLPDRPSWVVELNRYHSVVGWAGVDAKADPQQALETTWDYYALGHQHRCELNALPYSHSGRVDTDYIPQMTGEGADARVADWSEWDQRFGPLLDGSAFSAERGYVGPCANTPITQMYMAFHEAWPIFPVKEYYEDYMDVSTRVEFAEYAKQANRVADAFKPEYKEGFVDVVRQFFEHFNEKGWTDTAFQFYYNNKYYWKVAYFGGMSRGGICFWLLDEPTDFDDYDANRFLLDLARQGYEAANAPKTQIHYRTDVSQPEMHRGLWDNVCNMWNCSAMMRFGPTASVRQKWITDEYYWRYGGGPGVSAAPVAMHQRLLSSWALGTTGDLPYWDTFRGRGKAWRQAENLAVFYSGKDYCGSGKDYPGPIAGVRLKLMRRCQQDIEYLHVLAGRHGWDRPTVTRTLAEYCDDPDVPVWTFQNLTLRQVQELRDRVTATILGSKRPARM